jgi:S-layer protein
MTTGSMTADGGNNVTLTSTETVDATAAGATSSAISVGVTSAAAGAVSVTHTETFTDTTAGADTAAGSTIAVTGGTSVTVNSAAALGTKDDNSGDVATIGGISVAGNADTTSVTVVQTAASATTDAAGNKIDLANGAVTVTDLNTATKADTITTVALHNYGNSTITGNALTNLDLKGGAAIASGTLGISQSAGITTAGSIPTALTIDISGKVGAITDTNNQYKTLSVVASAAATIADLDFTSATSIAASGAGVTTISAGTDIAAATTITSTGGGLTVTPALGNGVTFTGGDGKETISVAATTKAITTGAGADQVTVGVSALGYLGSIDAGEGTDTLVMAAADAGTASATATFGGTISGFEVLALGAATADATIALAKLDSMNTVSTNGVANGDTVTITGASSGFTLAANAGVAGTVVASMTDATGTADVANVSVTATAAKTIAALTLTGFEVLNFDTQDSQATASGLQHVVTALTDADATTINVAGDAGLNLGFTGTKVTSFDASGVTKGAVTWTSGALAAAATVKGGAGANTIDLDAGNKAVTYTGQGGVDTVDTGNGADTIVGGAGNDVIDAGNGANTVHGDAGNDNITTGTGADTIEGGAGNDTIAAGNGANTINGGDGNDGITGGSGVDTVDGGAGTDTFTLDNTEQAGSGTVDGSVINLSDTALTQSSVFSLTGKYLTTVNASVAPGTATYLYSNESSTNADVVDTIVNVENVVGTGEIDYIVGSSGANTIDAGAGADYVTGGAGVDTFNQDGTDSVATSAETIAAGASGAIAAGDTLTFANGVDVISDFAAGNGGDILDTVNGSAATTGIGETEDDLTEDTVFFFSGAFTASTGAFVIAADGTGADTLIIENETTAANDDIASNTTAVVLVGVDSDDLIGYNMGA